MELFRMTSFLESRFIVAFALLILLFKQSSYGQLLPTDATCFPCNDGSCIPTFLICDGFSHCVGGEDEDGCFIGTCQPSFFACNDGLCIPDFVVCDGFPHCIGGEDELFCSDNTCSPDQFVCNDGECIPQSWFCDGINDCSGNEDELFCPGNTCEPSDFVCNDGTCIPEFLVCNGSPTCIGGEDELFCSDGTCELSDFVCNDGTCLPQFFVCDGYPTCLEGEDEFFCPDTCGPFEFVCFFDDSCISQVYVCNGFPNCPGGEDEFFCPPPCGPSEVMCDVGFCLPNFTVCNGFQDCPNARDEFDCPNSCASPTPLTISGSIFSSPNFPALNTHLTECSFTARAPAGQVVVVFFTAFDSYDPDLGCLFLLLISDEVNGTILEPSCRSSIPLPVVSVSNMVRIVYSSSGKEFRQGKGFEASVKFVNQSDLEELQCDDNVFLSEGFLTSPGFPELYPNSMECVYSIVAPTGQIVRLSFISFSVEDHVSCDFDSLSIFDVISSTSSLLAKLCGSSLPADLRSSERALFVVFTTDTFVRHTGFNASISFETPKCHMVIPAVGLHLFDNDMNCTYLLQAPPGYRLTVELLPFGSFNCKNETFLVYDGNSTNATLLLDLCNPSAFTVFPEGNEIFVAVISPFNSSEFGSFFILIQAIEPCNASFVSSGVFTSPNYPSPYDPNGHCEFLAEAPSGKIIGLAFNAFDVDDTPDCDSDSVKVYDGRDTSAPLLANLCGFDLPSSIKSTSSEMFVTFTSDATNSASGFQAAFVFLDDPSPDCIQFIVPPFPLTDSDMDCIYYLKIQDLQEAVFVDFLDLNLNCDSDTLLAFDGGTSDAPLLLDSSVDICQPGSDNQPQIQSSGSEMIILFTSTNHSSTSGILLAFAFPGFVEPDDCGGVFNKNGSMFTSPNYPFNYNNNDDCEYLAIAPAGKVIELSFSAFNLELHSTCVWDSVNVYDGHSTNAPLLGTFCGADIPEIVLSSGNMLFVKFTSDGSVTGSGFEGSFIFSNFFEAGCNQYLNVSGDVFQSRNFPNSYGNNANCHYLIRAPNDKIVRIFFLSFELDGNCQADSLMIFDGNSTEAILLDTLCGFEVPKPFTFSGNEAYLVFSSDSFISYQGFLATVIFLDAEPGLALNPNLKTTVIPNLQQFTFDTNVTDDLSAENGAPCIDFISINGTTISSPNFPLDYHNNVTCNFIALAPPEHLVKLVFESFDVEYEPSCLWDSVQVVDYTLDGNSNPLGALCGSNIPEVIHSSHYQLDLIFLSDSTITRPGFQATFYFIEKGDCRDTFTVNGSRFTTPHYPFIPEPPGQICEFVATASEGEIVELHFTSFDVGSLSLDCSLGSVKVYDGNSVNDPLLATLCGFILPRNVYSSGREMLVTFNSSSSLSTGFEAFFNFFSEEIVTSCFEEVSEGGSVITFPFVIDITTCTYQIQAPEGFRVALILTELHLGISPVDCFSDEMHPVGVSIFDGNQETAPLLLRYCSSSVPVAIEATGNQMLVISRTTPYVEPFAFSAIVKFVPMEQSQCMHTIFGSGSLITSPSFENNALCDYLIVAPEGATIVLSFLFFSLEEDPNCMFDSLTVYDGDSEESPHLATLCGCVVPDPVESTQNQMFLRFMTDFLVSSAGFTAHAFVGVPGVTCEPSDFTCNDGLCIPEFLVCDGFPTCIGGEDELFCPENTCEPSDFVCDDGFCIPDFLVCDGIPACVGGEDELFCSNSTCQPSFFACNDGLCIPDFFVCDGFPACVGGEDELFCSNSTCQPSFFACNDGLCIPDFFVCDGFPACVGGEDELFCSNSTCQPSFFACNDGLCIPDFFVCDGFPACVGGEDELFCSNSTCQPSFFACNDGLCIPDFFVCDGFPACVGGEDELFCSNSTCQPSFFACNDGLCIPDFFVCDGFPACVGGEDELFCSNSTCQPSFFACNDGLCIPDFFVCDGFPACVGGEDELFCSNSTCQPSFFACNDGLCIPDFFVCDGFPACVGGEDELFCSNSTCQPSFFACNDGLCIPDFFVCDGFPDCVGGVDELFCSNSTCQPSFFACNDGLCIPDFFVCDGFPACVGGEDELFCSNSTCQPSFFACNDGLCIPEFLVCDGFPTCIEGEDELFCSDNTCEPSDFVCNDGTCIPEFFVCDGITHCIGDEDELFCTCELSDFVCNDGTCLPQFFVCDGYPTCLEGEDEFFCPNTCGPFEFVCFLDGSCILQLNVCDGFPNCPGGADELFCPPPCGPSEVMCDVGFCLPNFTVCNGFQDCPNAKDEFDCPNSCASPTPLIESGSIFSSPNFPALNTHLTECSFTARAPAGQLVVVFFTAFDSYDPDLGCLFLLLISDESNGILLAPSCRSSIPPPVVSVSDMVRIVYSSSGKEFRQGKGFEAFVKFVNQSDFQELQCDDNVFFSEGFLTSPGFPELYPNSMECVYSVVAPTGQIVRLSFISFSVEDHASCDFDSLSIFDVMSSTSSLLAKLCGSSLPADLRSSGTALFVVFTTDDFERRTGFNASITFETPKCHMVIPVTGLNLFADNDMNCTYLLLAPPGYTLTVPFVDFVPFDCENETFVIYDGNSTNATLLIDLCNSPVFPVFTTGNEMFVVVISPFHSPNFGIVFAVVEAVFTEPCNASFVSSGVFTSPNYPSLYDPNGHCEFLAEAPNGKIIGLAFNAFDVDDTPDCDSDSVKVYDGRDTSAPLLANLCGFDLPSSIKSTSSEMFVTFTSDATNSASGFQAAFVFLDDPSIDCIQFIVPSTALSDSDMDCIYYLNTQDLQQAVFVDFVSLNINCDSDTLLAFDGGTSDAPLLLDSSVDICQPGSDNQPQIQSSGSEMVILFTSTNHSSTSGILLAFALSNFIEPDDCGGVFNKNGSTFTSPNYPFDYNNNDDCEYLAIAPAGKIIELSFSAFNLESHPTCVWDSVNVYDGDSTNAPLLGTFCGAEIPKIVLSSGNMLFVKFTSDFSVTRSGFEGSFIFSNFFEAGCNQYVNVSGDVFRSRNFPNSYGNDANCHYLIRAPNDKIVRIFFLSFELDGNCQADSLMIFDGNSTEATLLDTLCGFEVPKPLTFSGNEAYLVFSSDSFISYQGFLATVIFLDAEPELALHPSVKTAIIPDLQQFSFATNVTDDFSAENGAPCMDFISINGTTISSPNFPLDYNNDVTCNFSASAPPEHLVKLVFESFDVEYEPSCLWDFVQVVDYTLDGNFNPLGALCGSNIPEVIHSSFDQLELIFRTDSSITRPGFQATFYFIEKGDFRETFTLNGSRFTTPHYPFIPEPPGQFCEFVATAPEGEIVQLQFTSFDVGSLLLDCSLGSVKVYDGNSVNDPLLATLCGSILPRNVYSSGREMLVTFNSSSSFSTGFEAFFNFFSEEIVTSCFEEVSEGGSVITFPFVIDITTCTYQIQAPEGFRVALILTGLHLGISPVDCFSDEMHPVGVSIFDGNQETAPLLLRYCSSSVPVAIEATGNQMLVISRTTPYVEPFAFSAIVKFVSMEQSQCMHTIFGSGSLITSPSFENNAVCDYLIVAPEGTTIVLSFPFFSLEEDPNCMFDSLTVYDGDSEESPHLATLCGCLVPDPVESTQNQMFLHFMTDFLVSSAGFTAEATFALGDLETTESLQTTTSAEFTTPSDTEFTMSEYFSTTEREEGTTDRGIETTTGFGDCGFQALSVGGNCYLVINEAAGSTFSAANAECQAIQGNLVQVTPELALQDGLETLLDWNNIENAWIGLRSETTNNYRWVVDNSIPSESNWDVGEPQLSCVYVTNNDGKWRTDNCDSANYAAICEIPETEFQQRALQDDDKLSCDDVNPCLGSHVTCMDDSTDPYCVCESGYEFVDNSQRECTDVNECLGGIYDCDLSANLVCVNEEGGYSCRCLDGFTIAADGTCQRGNSTINSDPERYISTLSAFRITAINQQAAVFSTDLMDETSDEYKLMASFTCTAVMEVFSRIPSIPATSCSVLGFRSGSIRVFLQLQIVLRETALSTEDIEETFMSMLHDDSNSFKVLKRTNGDSLTLDGNSVRFEYINEISCDDFVCHNGGSCQLDPKIYERGCLCNPDFTGSRCETEMTKGTLTTQEIDTESVVTQERSTSTVFILIPVAVAAGVMFLITCCCCVTLKHNTDKKAALYQQHSPVNVIHLHGMGGNTTLHMPKVVRNPTGGAIEVEEERRLKHFERVFSEMRTSGRQSTQNHPLTYQTESSSRLSEFSNPYTADGSVNF